MSRTVNWLGRAFSIAAVGAGALIAGEMWSGQRTSAAAQSNCQDLQSLTAEVRSLRLTVERTMQAGAQVQVALQRLRMHGDSAAQLAAQLADVRGRLEQAVAQQERTQQVIEQLESPSAQAGDVQRRAVMAQELASFKLQALQEAAARERLEGVERQVAADLAAAQAQSVEVAGRLESLERVLAGQNRE
jgi:hypothetical protein